MKSFTLTIIALVLCFGSSNMSASNMPDPAVSAYVETEFGGFMVERNQGIKYAMTYKLLPPSESATTYKVVFENTIPKRDPITVEGTIIPGTPELLVQSPVIPGVKNGRTFSVLLTLYIDGELLANHNDQVKFSMPTKLLKQMGIKKY